LPRGNALNGKSNHLSVAIKEVNPNYKQYAEVPGTVHLVGGYWIPGLDAGEELRDGARATGHIAPTGGCAGFHQNSERLWEAFVMSVTLQS
jgi:hypothetical protein